MDDDLWTDILQAFEQEAGEHPASKPEGWELCLLARVAASRLESTKSVRKTLAKRIERLLLAAEPRLDDCRGVLARGLGNAIELSAPIQEARRLVSRSLTSRSRSPRRESLRQAHTLLEKAGSAWKNQPDAVEVAANLLSAGEALSLEEISARTLVAVACAAYRNPLRNPCRMWCHARELGEADACHWYVELSQDGGDPQELAEEVAAPDTASVQNGTETRTEVTRQSSALASREVDFSELQKAVRHRSSVLCVAAHLKDSRAVMHVGLKRRRMPRATGDSIQPRPHPNASCSRGALWCLHRKWLKTLSGTGTNRADLGRET